MTTRRAFLSGFASLVAAPAVIRTPGLLMPVRVVPCRIVRIPLAIIGKESWATAPGDVSRMYISQRDGALFRFSAG